jgi:hypothetical protein
VRTDSNGVVYVVWEGTDIKTKGSVFFLARSTDGGNNFEKPRAVAQVSDVGAFDPVSGRIVFDGLAGTRTDSFPSLSVANGAPTGNDATNTLVLTWPDGANGLNSEQALVQTSADGGTTWSAPVNAAESVDRPDNPAVAISPDGTDVYLVYNAYLQPFQITTANPRQMQGVTRHADVGAVEFSARSRPCTVQQSATPGARPAPSIVRASTTTSTRPPHATTASRYGWTLGTPSDCPAVDSYRQSLIDGVPIAAPSPLIDCPAQFGNSDIYSGSFVDPSP